MSDPVLAVLVPTRSRPHTVIPLAEAFAATCTAQTWLILCVDGFSAQDPDCQAYENAQRFVKDIVYPHTAFMRGKRRRLVGTLNHYARLLVGNHAPDAVGYMGDDHRPETRGWDTRMLSELHEMGGTGILYGDDGYQHANLPTAVVISADIIGQLQAMAPAVLTHMYCDNYWRDLGEGAGCLRYLPDVVIRHHHPAAGLAGWDESYRESNSAERFAADKAAYAMYSQQYLPHDIAAVTQLRGGQP